MAKDKPDTHHQNPIVPGATCIVRCQCGYGHDVDADSPEHAIDIIAARHGCPREQLSAEFHDYSEHPLYQRHEHAQALKRSHARVIGKSIEAMVRTLGQEAAH